jgi:hypothetical protein
MIVYLIKKEGLRYRKELRSIGRRKPNGGAGFRLRSFQSATVSLQPDKGYASQF